MKKSTKIPLWVAVNLSLAGATPVYAAPLQPDAETLLLAGFDQRGDHADYANGWDAFGGGGYSLVEGYYGKAVDLRGVRLSDDFWKTENGFLPHYTQWIFWPRGNVDFRQGTLEFWLRPAASGEKRPAIGGGDLIHFQSYQPLRSQPDGKGGEPKAVQPYVRLTSRSMSWLFVTLGGKQVKGEVRFPLVPGWKKPLSPDQWHHFCLQWAPEGIAVYLDGRLVGSHPLENDFGLALTAPTQRGIALNGALMDEFRISSRPRYGERFEPNWREGHRPESAFPGIAEARPIAWKPHLQAMPLAASSPARPLLREEALGSWKLGFDKRSGALLSLRNGEISAATGAEAAGLLLWRGVAREPIGDPAAGETWSRKAGEVHFTQQWADRLTVRHALHPGQSGELVWKMTFENGGDERQWLEALLAMPVMPGASEFFDMSWPQAKLPYPRRRDEYLFSLPMVAASDGKQGLGAGLNPRQGASALIGEWLPGKPGAGGADPIIRQGTRVVLAPGESQTLEFVLIRSGGEFGVRDTLAAYHALFPDLYKIDPKYPIYSSMGVAQYFSYVNIPDLTRYYYTGGQWGHGPYHTKGDYLGDPRFWGRKDLEGRVDYQHALDNERRYKSREGLANAVVRQSRDAFNLYYTPRRSHDVPNLTARFIVEELMPGAEFPDDPLTCGQYFAPKNLVVNEYKTPLGEKFKKDQEETMRLIAAWSPGFINDFCQSASYRFTDAFARQSPGRAFAEDRGEYLVAAFGHMDRYRMINDFATGGRHQSTISDWGMVSYMLSAWSVANTFESGCPFASTSGMKLGLQVSRNLLGEKPISVLTSYGLDNIGTQFEPGDFTPERLRDYYRFAYRRMMLTALETGYYVDPPLLHGKQWNSEVNPILVESLVHGRKTVAGGRVAEPLWLVRGGEGSRAVVVVGNSTTAEQETPVTLFHRYFGGRYLWAPYFGGSLVQSVAEHATELAPIHLKPHDIAAGKPVAELLGTGNTEATAEWSGDGLELTIRLRLKSASAGKIRILIPSEYYEVAALRIDGKPLAGNAEGVFPLPAGESVVEATLRNTVLKFGTTEWNAVELIRDGKPNFCVLGSARPGYEYGTASQLNWFLRQYDEEDGVPGNLEDAPIYASEAEIPQPFGGWVVDLRPDPEITGAEVRIDPKAKRIRLAGRTPGEVRRGMMLLMRLVDRKYVHIGRNVPMDRNLIAGWKQPGWNSTYNEADPGWKRLYQRRTKTLAFFEQFEDKQFLVKPILEKEQELLYAGGNIDFEGKYRLRHAPYLFEPTFGEDYIYGYDGPREE